jgi:hypothetical protein
LLEDCILAAYPPFAFFFAFMVAFVQRGISNIVHPVEKQWLHWPPQQAIELAF